MLDLRDNIHDWTALERVYTLKRPLVHLQVQLLASLLENIEHVRSRIDLDADPLDIRRNDNHVRRHLDEGELEGGELLRTLYNVVDRCWSERLRKPKDALLQGVTLPFSELVGR